MEISKLMMGSKKDHEVRKRTTSEPKRERGGARMGSLTLKICYTYNSQSSSSERIEPDSLLNFLLFGLLNDNPYRQRNQMPQTPPCPEEPIFRKILGKSVRFCNS
jgi:hypothetical protein